jgi:4a-hydroxytetrahydrobiopterin dehydratase
MTMRLTAEQVTAQLQQVPQWRHLPEVRGGVIVRQFVFADFAQAMGFMTQVAVVAEKRDHHPEWSNVYNRVEVLLTTHDVQGLSSRDFELARYMDRVAQALAGQERI